MIKHKRSQVGSSDEGAFVAIIIIILAAIGVWQIGSWIFEKDEVTATAQAAATPSAEPAKANTGVSNNGVYVMEDIREHEMSQKIHKFVNKHPELRVVSVVYGGDYNSLVFVTEPREQSPVKAEAERYRPLETEIATPGDIQ